MQNSIGRREDAVTIVTMISLRRELAWVGLIDSASWLTIILTDSWSDKSVLTTSINDSYRIKTVECIKIEDRMLSNR
jgi:hypothetical protein